MVVEAETSGSAYMTASDANATSTRNLVTAADHMPLTGVLPSFFLGRRARGALGSLPWLRRRGKRSIGLGTQGGGGG